MFPKRNRSRKQWRVTKARKRKKRPFKSTEPAFVRILDGVIEFSLSRKLVSPNRLKTGLARHGDTKGWQTAFEKANVMTDDGSFRAPVEQRVKLEVTRLAPREQFFLDQTNLAFSVKGLEDALVRLGYLKDDNHAWLDGPYVTQDVSPDGKYHTHVRITLCDPPKPKPFKVSKLPPPLTVAQTAEKFGLDPLLVEEIAAAMRRKRPRRQVLPDPE